MKYNIFSTFTLVLGRFFRGSGFFWIGPGFLADPDPDSEKKVRSGSGEKNGSKTLHFWSTLTVNRFKSLTTGQGCKNKN